jgi:hypothetical protein
VARRSRGGRDPSGFNDRGGGRGLARRRAVGTIDNMTRPNPIPTMSDTLRTAIARSGLSLLKLQHETGVHRGSLSRFIRGERSLRLDVADKLAAYFHLELRRHSGRPDGTPSE